MKISKERILLNKDFMLAALEHLAYSFEDIENYNELTSKEKKIISKEMFNEIKC